MISRGQIMARLRDADFTLCKKTKRTELWRKRGGLIYVALPHRANFTLDETRSILKQAKLTSEEVERFVEGCIKTEPN